MNLTGFGFTDTQLHTGRQAHYMGSVPDPVWPHRVWLEGPLRQRPICAPPGTFYVTTDGNGVWIYEHPDFQMGPLNEIGSIGQQGLTYFATDTLQIFVWMV